LGPCTSIWDNTTLSYVEIENLIAIKGVKIDGIRGRISDSIIGNGAVITNVKTCFRATSL